MSRVPCVQCGKKYRDDKELCPRCGYPNPTRFQDLSSLETPLDQTASTSRMKICEDCGQTISRRALACPHCGAPQGSALSRKPDWGFEWKSDASIGSFPLIHVAIGRKNGKLRVAKGVIAIGQFAIGLITVAQFGVGILFGFGQFILGTTALAQFAIAALFGIGQFATGFVAIGQFAVGTYALAQIALAKHAWTPEFQDPAAVEFFRNLASMVGFVGPKP